MKKNLPLLLIAVLFITSCGKESTSSSSMLTSSVLTNVFAGSGSQGSANGTGTGASFYEPAGIAIDASGNVYVADYGNNLVREISAAGVVTTLAGSSTAGSANGTGISASFYEPTGVAVDGSGNVYVADKGNNLIRKISAGGVVTTFAGSGTGGSANGKGTAASFYHPTGVATDASGNVYVADNSNNLVREISPTGVVTTLAGSGAQGAANGTGTAASFSEPMAVTVDGSGNVYVADYGNNVVRKISPTGVVTTLAGSGISGLADGTGTEAYFSSITGITLDASGNVYVADNGNNLVRQISQAGVVTTFDSNAGNTLFNGAYGVALDAAGNIYVSDYTGNAIQKISN